jgi:hypothetical protein
VIEAWQNHANFDSEWLNVRQLTDLEPEPWLGHIRISFEVHLVGLNDPTRTNHSLWAAKTALDRIRIYLNMVGPVSYYYIHIVSYSYPVVFIFSRRRIHVYLNTFKIYFSVSYLWPALLQASHAFLLYLTSLIEDLSECGNSQCIIAYR